MITVVTSLYVPDTDNNRAVEPMGNDDSFWIVADEVPSSEDGGLLRRLKREPFDYYDDEPRATRRGLHYKKVYKYRALHLNKKKLFVPNLWG